MHISSRLHQSFLSWGNKGDFATFWLKHLRLCSHFGLAFRIWNRPTFSLHQLNRASFLTHLTRALLHNSVHHPESDSFTTVLISGYLQEGAGPGRALFKLTSAVYFLLLSMAVYSHLKIAHISYMGLI